MVAQKREKRRSRATLQAADVLIKISHLSESFPASYVHISHAFQEGWWGHDPALAGQNSQQPISTTVKEEQLRKKFWFHLQNMQDGIFVVEKEASPPPFPLSY